MNQFFSVFKFEYSRMIRNKVFLWVTVIFVAIIGIILSFPALQGLFSSQNGSDSGKAASPETLPKVTVVDKTGMLKDTSAFSSIKGYSFVLDNTASEDTLKRDINNGSVTAAVVINEPLKFTYMEKRVMDSTLLTQVQSALDILYKSSAMTQSGMTKAQIQQTLQSPQPTIEETGKGFEQTYFYTYVLIMLLYMSIMMYGQLVATSVAGEKSSRAMEMLITSAKPANLLFGKVLGNGAAGLTQIAIFLLAATGFYQMNSSYWANNAIVSSIFNMSAGTMLNVLVFYILGYFIFAFLYGAVGSLASKVEDINTTSMPLILLSVAGLMLSFIAIMNPDGTASVILSLIPFFAPTVMFVRINMSVVPVWQIALCIALMLGTIALVGWLAAKIYKTGVMMYGKSPKLSELRKVLKESKNMNAK